MAKAAQDQPVFFFTKSTISFCCCFFFSTTETNKSFYPIDIPVANISVSYQPAAAGAAGPGWGEPAASASRFTRLLRGNLRQNSAIARLTEEAFYGARETPLNK